MHSIVVLGDVRSHRVKHGKETTTIYGGASLMKDHIVDAIDGISFDTPKSRSAPPRVFSFEGLDAESDGIIGFEVKTWKTQKVHLKDSLYLDDGISERPRLKSLCEEETHFEPHDKSTDYYPAVAKDLIHALGRYRVIAPLDGDSEPPIYPRPTRGSVTHLGHFDPPYARLPWCPDILVFDDLNGPLREIELPDSSTSADIPVFREPSLPKTSPAWKAAEARYAAVLRTVLDRVVRASLPNSNRGGGPSLEPVIVCSVMGKPPRLTVQNPANANHPKLLWDILYRDPRLRRRTVVIMDVKDLRGAGNLTISPGSSWEITAQDIIVELNRSPDLRRLLDFSQVIIRIGHTGALQISRCDERESSYQLYFDPCRDETTWNEPKDGTVLGQSSHFVAGIVEELVRNCNAQWEHPVLQDLVDVVGQAIPRAIRSCQEMMNRGLDFLESPPVPTRVPLRPTDQLSSISCVAVPSYRNRSWSILSQVSQGQVGTIARNIVRYGTESALLQSVPSIRWLIRSVADAASDVVLQVLLPHAVGRPKWTVGTDPVADESAYDNLAARAGTEGPILRFIPGGRKHDLGDYIRIVIARRVASRIRLLAKHAQDFYGLFASPAHVRMIRERAESVVAGIPDGNVGRPLSDLPVLNDDYMNMIFQFERWVEQYYLDELDTNLKNDPRFRPVVAPVYKVGERVSLVDRREIEDVRGLRIRIRTHLEKVKSVGDPTKNKPLNLAVFGPPGAGKSIIVKEVIQSLEDKGRCTELTFNLAQFSTVADLDQAFQRIGNVSGVNKVPVVFFDEFDCRFNGEPWGWLKYLISPMEDGIYRDTPVYTGIFVFAGGTSSTYSEFNRVESDSEFQQFKLAKGPDFSSRLSGHLNVVGVDQADDDDQLYLIRRAVVIRSMLENIQKKVIERNNNIVQIDEDILRAILFVPSYKNGARSIRKLIEMCPGSDERLQNSALPSLQQLNMVTNGKAFLDQLYKVSEV